MIRTAKGLFDVDDRLIGLVSKTGEVLYARKRDLVEHSVYFKEIFSQHLDDENDEKFQFNVSSHAITTYIGFIRHHVLISDMTRDEEVMSLVKFLGTVGVKKQLYEVSKSFIALLVKINYINKIQIAIFSTICQHVAGLDAVFAAPVDRHHLVLRRIGPSQCGRFPGHSRSLMHSAPCWRFARPAKSWCRARG